MIVAYFFFFILGSVAFVLMAKFGLPIRISVALAIFLIPSVVLTIWIVRVGDKPPADAITIEPSKTSNGESNGTQGGNHEDGDQDT